VIAAAGGGFLPGCVWCAEGEEGGEEVEEEEEEEEEKQEGREGEGDGDGEGGETGLREAGKASTRM